MLKKIYRLLFLSLAVIGAAYFCESQTKGFRFQEILSDIPNDPKWEVSGVSSTTIKPKLQQKFRYLGSGEQSHAFLGEDQKTVLKFFRHDDLSLLKIFKKLPPSVEMKFWDFFKSYNPRQVFDSCKLAYEALKDETGLYFLHINKTEGELGLAVIVDNSGVAHEIDLDRTEFMLQDYCELATNRINAHMEKGDLTGAKGDIRSLFAAIEEWTKMGIHIDNPALKRNIGFYGNKVIMLDIGSLRKGTPVENPEQIRQEVRHVTRGFGRWIAKHHPELVPFYEKQLKAKSPK
jgi:hypothetical protein